VPFVLLPSSTVAIDVATLCQLNGPDDVGTLTVFDTQGGTVARLSGVARIEVLDGQGQPDFGFTVDGIALGALEGSDSVHVVAGVRNGPSLGGPGSYRTDCFVASFYDKTGSGLAGEITLKDRDGRPLGSPVWFNLHAWELVRIKDVFGQAGVPSTFQQARAEVTLSGFDPSVLGYCLVVDTANRRSPATSFHLGKVVAPALETRRRLVDAESTPGVTPAGATFDFPAGGTIVAHVLHVRTPDLLSCSLDRSELLLTLVSPDKQQIIGGTSNAVAEFFTGERSAVGSRWHGPGWTDPWGLEVRWNPNVPRAAGPVPYRVHCRSGNGVSLADEVFRN
jgi:hypothetical protein